MNLNQPADSHNLISLHCPQEELLHPWPCKIRGMFEMNCLFLSGDFKFQVSPKVLISCPRSTPRG